jgi:hypothetical protein
MIESRCGLLCSECSFRESFNCGECKNIPEYCGENNCSKKDSNGHTLCGSCEKTTCGKLHSYSYTDPNHGDNPPGARIKRCKKWASEVKI